MNDNNNMPKYDNMQNQMMMKDANSCMMKGMQSCSAWTYAFDVLVLVGFAIIIVQLSKIVKQLGKK